jgi:GNAT superfamily N-acetyltransferase
VRVRPAHRTDARRIAELSGQLGYPATAGEIDSRMECLTADGRTAIFVAVSDDAAAVGWISVRSDLTLEGGSYAEIAGLVVDEAHRGRRIGEALLRAAEDWARAKGHGRIRVRSNVVRERAHGFYRRLGYQTTKHQAIFDKDLAELL